MLNVLLLEDSVDQGVLESALKEDGHNIFKIANGQSLLPVIEKAKPDIIVIHADYPSDSILGEVQRIEHSFPMPIVMFVKDTSSETIAKFINADVSAYVVDGLANRRVAPVIQVAISRFIKHRELMDAMEKMRIQLEDRKQIDRAKAILMKAQHFTEDDAYHTLRKLAMSRNVTLGEMARNVIAMAELLK